MYIIVNGKEINLSDRGLRAIDDNFLTYDFIVECAGYNPKHVFSVTYMSKFGEGILMVGKTVKLENGMVFDISDTSNA